MLLSAIMLSQCTCVKIIGTKGTSRVTNNGSGDFSHAGESIVNERQNAQCSYHRETYNNVVVYTSISYIGYYRKSYAGHTYTQEQTSTILACGESTTLTVEGE